MGMKLLEVNLEQLKQTTSIAQIVKHCTYFDKTMHNFFVCNRILFSRAFNGLVDAIDAKQAG
jgi:hypothetical protein